MGKLVPYTSDVLETDVLKLSLAEASRKYKNWETHENGTRIFGDLTLAIAIERIGNSMNLKHLDEDQRDFVCFHLAEGKRVREFLPSFREHFSDFGDGIDEKRLKRLLSDRFRKIGSVHSEKVEALAALIQPETDASKISGTSLLYQLQRHWWDLPGVLHLKKTGVDANSETYRLYQLHAQDHLKVLKKARLMSQGAAVDVIPIARPSYRLQCLQGLYTQVPLRTLTKVGKAANGETYRLYRSEAKIHLAILDLARNEFADDPDALIPIARPFYRMQCIQELFEVTSAVTSLLKVIENNRMAANAVDAHVILQLSIMKAARLEAKIIEKIGRSETDEESLRLSHG